MAGIQGNEYAVKSWNDYYQLSLKRTEFGVKKAKENWFDTEHDQWTEKNAGYLENAHLLQEFKN